MVYLIHGSSELPDVQPPICVPVHALHHMQLCKKLGHEQFSGMQQALMACSCINAAAGGASAGLHAAQPQHLLPELHAQPGICSACLKVLLHRDFSFTPNCSRLDMPLDGSRLKGVSRADKQELMNSTAL